MRIVRVPSPLSSIVGRSEHLAAIGADLEQDDVRLVTLTGPGGVGKTRLALELAANWLDSPVRQSIFVSLADVRDGELVLPAVAHAAGVAQDGRDPLLNRLATALRDQPHLVLVDNFEQLISAAPVIAQLLAAAPGVKVLVTSRERLHLSGEHERVVPPLELPKEVRPGQPIDQAELARNPAVQLFLERAPGVQADLVTVADICRRLDGLPLAIDLIAARSKLLPPAALLDRLDRRLPLLVGGSRDLPDRLQTMHDAIFWSYDLLSADEQAYFRQLAIFAGGFTLPAALAVGPGGPARSRESVMPAGASSMVALDLLAALVDKSLVQTETQANGSLRYRILAPIREFGLEQLVQVGDESVARARHAAWGAALAAVAPPFPLRETFQPEILEQLELEVDNLRLVLNWFADQGDAASLARVATDLTQFCALRGFRREGVGWLKRALVLAETQPVADELHAALFHAAGALSRTLGDHDQAVALISQGLQRVRAMNDPWRIASHIHVLGLVERARRNFSQAEVLHQEALRHFQAMNEPFWIAVLSCDLGLLSYLWKGGSPQATALLTEALQGFRALDDSWGVGLTLSVIAEVEGEGGNLAAASAHFRESLDHVTRVGSREMLVDTVSRIATLAAATGKATTAARLLGAVQAWSQRLGYSLEQQDQDRGRDAAATAHAELGDEFFAGAWAGGSAMSMPAMIAEAEQFLAGPELTQAAPFGLTPRELEILRRLAAGEDDETIAEHLFVSPATVARHIGNLSAKLNADSRARAIALAYQHQLT